MHPVPTKTLIARMKRDAKARAKRDAIPHSTALEQLAREAGYASWHAVVSTAPSVTPETGTDPRLPPLPTHLPIDPVVPKRFDSTPNELRSKRQLDQWWDRPYAVRNADGSLTVRTLSGGSWDRSTALGRAETETEALELARTKLAEWRALRERPMPYVRGAAGYDLVRMPQRPDWEMETILQSVTAEEFRAWMSHHYPE